MRTTALFVLLAAVPLAATAADKDTIVGSGKLVTNEVKIVDFTAVEVSSAFQVKVTRADTFRVAVTADDNVIEHVKVTKTGSTLEIALDNRKNYRLQGTTLTATIAMPALEVMTLTGATQATVEGFKSAKLFKAKLVGASTLQGDLEAGNVEVDAQGASLVALKGSAKEATLSAAGASRLQLAEFAVAGAAVTLSGASAATVKANERLDYDLSGASRLEIRGAPVGKGKATGASSASRK